MAGRTARSIVNQKAYDGKTITSERWLEEKQLIMCHRSGMYFERELMVQVNGKWIYKDLLDYDPITGEYK